MNGHAVLPDQIAGLLKPGAYPHDTRNLRVVETHISWVLLTGEYAYKIKKAVDFGFLDYSTLQKRKFFCEEETRLNSRFAPDLYLDVVAISRKDGKLRISGDGEVIEYAVRMRQFPQAAQLDRLLDAGELEPVDILNAARQISAYHEKAEVAAVGTSFGAPDHVAAPMMENFLQILPRLVDKALDNEEFAQYRAATAAGLAGEVLELGFGSGLNVPHLPPEVTRLLAVDPALLGRRLARERLAAAPVPVEFMGLDAQRLPLDDASVDGVLCTMTLCTIPDPAAALAEVRRVLRPGGRFHFLEHGAAPDPRTARWQRWIEPIHKRVFGGCHLTRPIDGLLLGAGFALDTLERFWSDAGPRYAGAMYRGVARPVAALG